MGALPIFSLADVPAKPAECRTAEASIHILMSYHQSNVPVLLMWEGEEGQDSSYHLMTYCGLKSLERSIITPPLPHEGKWIFVFRNLYLSMSLFYEPP